MRKYPINPFYALLALALTVATFSLSFKGKGLEPEGSESDSLRLIYSRPQAEWPAPWVDSGANWKPLGAMPVKLLDVLPRKQPDSLRKIIELGRTLFFDPILSGSNQISCSNCHDPELNWGDNRRTAIGEDHQRGNRNSPSLLNVWQVKKLFWDGRSGSLEDQALQPIQNPIEMNQLIPELVKELNDIKAYREEFGKAFGQKKASAERIAKALAAFERTIVSRPTKFDKFVEGKKEALSDRELRGMHLFRTKAKCMNCHSGPYFTNGEFHNIGLTYYHSDKYRDLGLYEVTKNPEDVGKFRVPALREVMRTGPWMHNGLFTVMDGIMNMYNAGMPRPKRKEHQKDDKLFPQTSHLVHELDLSKEERDDIVAFLQSITSRPYYQLDRPELPRDK
ncbi:methylamine utilization protein [Fulvitalea axinellae]|uniref:Methylamine utilization protein MauG n=1 Tax=Fulvitalea axinellae TaxID=1182444 RepID=A0AAU9CVH5_9BACT|nr:methylamine utilization protein [Fulvitalea axinellae]